MRLATFLLVALVLPLAACQKPMPEEPTKPTEPTVTHAEHPASNSVHDVNSYAEPEKVVVKHLTLDLAVDFAKKVLAGSATLDLGWKDPAATTLVLDTRDLDIAKIEGFDGSAWQELKFELAREGPDLRQQAVASPCPSRWRRCASTTAAARRPPACSG